jgi:hypothetical protein
LHGHTRKVLGVVLAIGPIASIGLSGCAPAQTGGETPDQRATKGGTLSFYVGDISYIDPYNTRESKVHMSSRPYSTRGRLIRSSRRRSSRLGRGSTPTPPFGRSAQSQWQVLRQYSREGAGFHHAWNRIANTRPRTRRPASRIPRC